MAMLNNQRVIFLVHTSYGKKVFHGIPHSVPWIPVPFQGHRFFLQVLILPVPLDPHGKTIMFHGKTIIFHGLTIMFHGRIIMFHGFTGKTHQFSWENQLFLW